MFVKPTKHHGYKRMAASIFACGIQPILIVEAIDACLPTDAASGGFTAKFYQYDFGDSSTFTSPAFMGYEYANRDLLTTVSSVNNIGFTWCMPYENWLGIWQNVQCGTGFSYSGCINQPNSSLQQGQIYEYTLDATNFVVELTGYFLAPQTGSYTIQLSQVDDAAVLDIGHGLAFDCCQQGVPPVQNTDFSINAIKPDNGDPGEMSATVSLVENYYYPIKIVYVNEVNYAVLQVAMTAPDGTVITNDFSGHVFSFPEDTQQPDCTVTNPAPFVTSTTTTARTGTFTTTFSTATTIVTLSGGSEAEEIVYEVETPSIPAITTTAFTGYSGTETSTYSTGATVFTGPDGNVTPETIYYVEMPTTPAAVSTTLLDPMEKPRQR